MIAKIERKFIVLVPDKFLSTVSMAMFTTQLNAPPTRATRKSLPKQSSQMNYSIVLTRYWR